MKYLIALIIIAAAVGGFAYLNNNNVGPDVINETETSTVEATTTTESANSNNSTNTTSNTDTSVNVGVDVSAATAKTVDVSYTDAGFSPTSITVNKGDSVKFTNNSSGNMWVASGPHPVHTNYPEFDQKKNVIKGETYTFKFDKTGTWGFHNHSNPSKFGSVIVK